MEFLRFDSFQNIPDLRHALTTRAGGVSSGEYSSLNLAFHVGDDEKAVRENRRILAASLDYDASTPVAAQQVHGADSVVVTRQDCGRGALDLESAIPECDALITREKNLPLLIQVADCASILIVDPIEKVLAVVHAGWRGAAAAVASKTLEQMAHEFGTNASEVFVGIGPCLCTACFEIGEEVVAEVSGSCVVRKPHWEKPHLDLRALITEDLARAGVLAAHIETMNLCPRCASENLGETFFSHRGQNGKAGRFGLVAWWE